MICDPHQELIFPIKKVLNMDSSPRRNGQGSRSKWGFRDEEDGRKQPHRREATGNWGKALRATLPKTELPLGANIQLASCQSGIQDGQPRYADDQL